MKAEAKISNNWLARMGLVWIVLFLAGLYFLYDGAIGYPNINKRYKAHEACKNNFSKWELLAKEKGWSSVPPQKKDIKSKTEIRMQFLMGGFCLLASTLMAIYVGWAFLKKMEVDDNGFLAINGDKISYDSITKIDKSKWERKLKAYVHYKKDGEELVTTVDDWIFQGGDEVLGEIEKNLQLLNLGVPIIEKASKDSE